MKAGELMKIVNDDDPSYYKLVKKLRKVYNRGKCVILSPLTFN